MTTPKPSELPAWSELVANALAIVNTTRPYEFGGEVINERHILSNLSTIRSALESLAAHPVSEPYGDHYYWYNGLADHPSRLLEVETTKHGDWITVRARFHETTHDDTERTHAHVTGLHWSPLPGATDPLVAEVERLKEELRMAREDKLDDSMAELGLDYMSWYRASIPPNYHPADSPLEFATEILFQVGYQNEELTNLRSQVEKLEAAKNNHICGSDDSGHMNRIRELLRVPDDHSNAEVVTAVAILQQRATPPDLSAIDHVEPRHDATVHELKTWPVYFGEVANGRKRFEVRKADRDFLEGDTVLLREWCPEMRDYTGETLTFRIGYVLRDFVPGFAVFALALTRASQPKGDK